MAAKDNNQQSTIRYINVSTVVTLKQFYHQEYELLGSLGGSLS